MTYATQLNVSLVAGPAAVIVAPERTMVVLVYVKPVVDGDTINEYI